MKKKTVQAESPNFEIRTDRLTIYQARVLLLLAEGLNYTQISEKLNRSYSTIEKHGGFIKERLDTSSLTEAIAVLLSTGELKKPLELNTRTHGSNVVLVETSRFIVADNDMHKDLAAVLAWIAEGKTFEEIGFILNLPKNTVEWISRKIIKAFNTHCTRTAVIEAMSNGLLLPKQVFMP